MCIVLYAPPALKKSPNVYLNSHSGKNNEEQIAACGLRNSLLNSSSSDTFTTQVLPTLLDKVGGKHY